MIDQYGLIVDQGGDAADSCNFTCCAIALGIFDPLKTAQAVNLFWNGGMPVRHPFQEPANNPGSFTRDQAVLLMQVLAPVQIRFFLKEHKWTFPNTERDWPGSQKYQRPHVFYEDSHPGPITLVKSFSFWTMRFAGDLTPTKYMSPNGGWRDAVIVHRNFDGPDLVTPDFTAMSMILAGDKPGFMHMSVARLMCKQAIADHCRQARADKSFSDFKQLYFTAKALGLHKAFANQHPLGLPFAAEQYFKVRRNLPELYEGFLTEFKREGIYE